MIAVGRSSGQHGCRQCADTDEYADFSPEYADDCRAIMCIMRTTLDIDPALLDEAIRRLRTRTKRETVEMALREAIASRKRQQLRDLLGSFDLDLTQEDLERMRGEP
jgi:Arc/MetJ family transcription regulator